MLRFFYFIILLFCIILVEKFKGCFTLEKSAVSAEYTNVSNYDEARATCHYEGKFYTGLSGYTNNSLLRGVCLDEDQFTELRAAPQYLCKEMSADGYLAGSNTTNATHMVLSVYQTFCEYSL